MGYDGAYSLGARCASEAFATFTFVFFVLTLHANKLLPKTKGHGLSFGWLAFGVGMAVFVPVQFLGHISSSLNPAMALGAALVGQIDYSDVPGIAASQMAGAFLAALVMYVFYYPKFRTVPEPAPACDADRLLRTRDDIPRTGLDYVSYNTRQPPTTPRRPSALTTNFNALRRRLSHQILRQSPGGSMVYSKTQVMGKEAEYRRRNSVMVADLHNRLGRLEEAERQRDGGATPRRYSEQDVPQGEHQMAEIHVRQLLPRGNDTAMLIDLSGGPSNGASTNQGGQENGAEDRRVVIAAAEKEEPVIAASKLADRHLKLAIFCTRPAHYEPIINLITEAIGTFFLVIGILFMKEREEFLYEGHDAVYGNGVKSLYIGLLISLLVLCLGGMGVAMNPARDLAPRLAHWILPIPGKGPSEWYYAWITLTGPLVGSCLAAGVFRVMIKLNETEVHGRLYDEDLEQIQSVLQTLV